MNDPTRWSLVFLYGALIALYASLAADLYKHNAIAVSLGVGAIALAYCMAVAAAKEEDGVVIVLALVMVALAMLVFLRQIGVIKPPAATGGTEPDKPK